MKELPKKIDFNSLEKWQEYWEKEKIFKFNPKSNKKIFSVDVPPVYASAGHLHIGHALHYTQFEFPTRYWRMNGKEVYFSPCFDDNGLPTEKMVEEKYKINKATTTREEFVKLCLKESKEVEKLYSEKVYKKLGHAYDWDLLYVTISKEAQKVAQTSFLDLVEKNLAYRGEEPTIWCIHHQTALAQAEVEDTQRTTILNHINFKLEDGEIINIATTRPEFLPACVAIFVNPQDKRYKKLIGKQAIVPIFKHKVKIMTDEAVDPEFGTGILMVCTFGDNADIEKWRKYKLDTKIIIDNDGKLNDIAGKYKGLTLEEAKAKIIKELKSQDLITKQEPLQQTIGTCWRCSTPVEYIVTKQWHIDILSHKKELIAQGKKVNWHPAFYRKRFEDWVSNLNWNWGISRQRFYGIPIPVWYCKDCDSPVFPDKKDLPIDPLKDPAPKKCSCGSTDLIPEDDVFDTWMTSSMTPQIASQWLENPKVFDKVFPMTLRPQSHDIIRTWAFYTITKSYYHLKSIPWKDVMIGTYILDPKGKGMHKSKGNAIWFDDLIKKYDVDSFRYWVSTAGIGEDIPFKEKDIIRGTKILIKLWNTARFIFINIDKVPNSKQKFTPLDLWITNQLHKVLNNYHKFFQEYKITKARKELEMFFLHDFCDFYLEAVKHRIYSENKETKNAAVYTLYNIFFNIIKMWAPIIPHITEEIYQTAFKEQEKEKSIHLCQFPKQKKPNKKSLELGVLAKMLISELRKWKQENNIKLGEEFDLVNLTHPDVDKLKTLKPELEGTLRIKNLHISKGKFSISM